MKKLSLIRKHMLKVFKALHVFALISSLLVSQISFALQIELKTAMKIRQFDDGSGSLDAVGILAAGSIVEIPDRYKVSRKGRVDAEATLAKWLKSAGYQRSTMRSKVRDPRLDFYFPVHIVKLGPGSTGRHLVGTTRFMALRVLERSEKGLVVKSKARAYAGTRGFLPLKPGMEVPSIAHAQARVPAPAKPAPAPAREQRQEIAQTTRPSYSPDQQDAEAQPVQETTPAAQDDSQSTADAETEAGTSSSDDCPSCNAARDEANSGAAPAADLGSQVRDAIAPAAYNSEAEGMQGLTNGFEASCSKFIERDGTYGPWGQKVLREISRYPEYMSDSRGTSNFCPNFNSFNDDQKRHFWVWLMAAVSSQEASCSAGAHAPRWMNANGIAVGLFQIEERSDLRAGRDDRYNGRFCSGDPYDTTVNIRCGVRMILDVVDNGDGPYAHRNNYYASLIHPGKARALISQYKACGADSYRSYRSTGKRHHHRSRRARSAR